MSKKKQKIKSLLDEYSYLDDSIVNSEFYLSKGLDVESEPEAKTRKEEIIKEIENRIKGDGE